MLGLAGSLRTSLDGRRMNCLALAAVVGALLGMSLLTSPSALATGGCDNWTNTAGGNYFTGTNWSKGAPPSSTEEGCITEAGTYTVTMTQESSTVSVGSLTVGGSSGTQTLVVASSCSKNAVLASTGGISIGAHGALTMTNGDGCKNSVTLEAPITNAGTLTSEAGVGGSRSIAGNLTNTGTFAVDTPTNYNGASAVLTNKGALDLAEAGQLSVSNAGTVFNETGGSIVALGSANIAMGSGTTFNQAAGTTGGTLPVIVDDGTLNYTGPGASTIALRGTAGTLSGTSVSGQTTSLQSTCSENATISAPTGFTNGGTLALTNGDSCKNFVTLAITGTLSNSGKLGSEVGVGGSRTIQGNVTNTGTIAINATTAYNGAGATLTNEGALDLANETALNVSNSGIVTNGSGGSIVATGSGDVALGSGTTFNQGAGTTTGTLPVIVDDGTLKYTGTGSSTISLRGTAGTLSGTSVSGQTTLLQSTCGENASLSAPSGFANGGTLTLTNGDSCKNFVTLAITGTLSNSGKLGSEAGVGGSRTIQGNVTNTGTIAINTNTSYNEKGTLTNEGAIDLAEGVSLSVSGGSTVTNGKGGSIVATGNGNVLLGSGTIFNESTGTTTGTLPVIVDDATLNYSGATGTSTIASRGSTSLTGSLVSGQSLQVQSTCGENAVTTAAASFKNGGTIALTNGDSCKNNATLAVSGEGTLTSGGKIVSELEHGGNRTIEGNLTNNGQIVIRTNTAYNGKSTLLTNQNALNIAEGVQLSVSNGASVTNGTGGSIAATGTTPGNLSLSGGTFTEGAGTTSGPRPVILDDSTLDYTGAGKSVIWLEGSSSSLAGNLSSGQSLSIASTCNEHAVATLKESIVSGGTITLTNGDGCKNNATIVTSTFTLTNTGQIDSEAGVGGSRAIEGNLTNNGTVTIGANTGDSASGATIKNNGAIDLSEGAAFSITGGATVTNGTGGSIAGAKTGVLSQTSGTFNQAAGTTAGVEPVVLDNVALNYTEHGAGPIDLRGASTLSGTVRTGETLVISSTCGQHAVVTPVASFNSNGNLELSNAEGCGNNATISMPGETLTNNGNLNILNPHGGSRTIEGNLVNNAVVGVAAGETLKLTGNYSQSSTGKFKTFIASSSNFGTMAVSGSASLGGTLVVRQIEFKASLGQSYPIITSSSLTGTFAAEVEDQINSTGLYYKPTYSATAATLVASQATQVHSPKNGLPGSTVQISGTGYLPGDTITPKFKDHAGVTTLYPPVTTNSEGEFSTEITIPEGATPGIGEITVTSTETGVHIIQSFTVNAPKA